MQAEKQNHTSPKGSTNLETKAWTSCTTPQPRSLLCPQANRVSPHLSRWRMGTAWSVQPKVSEQSLVTVHFGTQKILGYVLGRASQRHTLAFCSALLSTHAFFPSPLPLLKAFTFLPPHDRLFSPQLTAKLLFQAYKCMKNMNCVFRPSSAWKSKQCQFKFSSYLQWPPKLLPQ